MNLAKKLLHTRYRVNDLERTVKFYREVLGLEEVRRHKSPRGSELVFLKAPQGEELIEICYFPGSESVKVQPDLTHLAFEVYSVKPDALDPLPMLVVFGSQADNFHGMSRFRKSFRFAEYAGIPFKFDVPCHQNSFQG